MSFFGNDGKVTYDWRIFLDNFPNIGVFKLPHGNEDAYLDKNVSSILQLDADRIPKEKLFELIDKLSENTVEGYKNIYIYRVNGETLYINMKVVYEHEYLLGFVQDVTATMQAQPPEEAESEYDRLTGLLSRNSFIKRVRNALSQISGMAQCCMAAVHVNGVERVDSELNYDKTKLCISAAAGAIKRFESEDVIIGVKSYKDFFVFFKQLTRQEVSELLKKMSDSVKACRITDEFGNEIQTRSGFFSLSVGYCWYPSQAATIDMMINYADFALFRAIALGNKTREFSPDEYVSEQNSYADSSQLAEIIDNNEFEYCFQPIVSAVTGDIYAYEALMRPKNLTPLELLRIAREHNRLYDIELLTFENVLAAVSDMGDKFADRKIFINSIPDFMLKEHDFNRLYDKYPDVIGKTVIELTEEADLTNEHIKRLIELFCEKGCMTAIDDYGSGYSNTAAVLSLSPDIIKIDRTLISDIDKNTRKQHFLSGIIDFAKMNGIKVLAEGVETFEEMNMVIRRGVDFIQGFYTARPFPNVSSSISADIVSAIKSVNASKPDLKPAKTYHLRENAYEPISIKSIADNGYTSITISCSYVCFKEESDETVNMNILVAENTSVNMVMQNVSLNGGARSCITIGENARVRLEVCGNNTFYYDGIVLPDSADLTLVGDGNLYIDSTRNNGCCLGASYNDSFGRIIVDMSGTLEMTANGDHSVCIGGGMTSRKNALSIMNGTIKASVTGVESLGIGAYTGNCGIFVGNGSNVTINTSGDNSVAIGSLYGIAETTASLCKLKLYSLGVHACGIGTLATASSVNNQVINLSQVTADVTIKARRGAAIGFVDAESNIMLKDSDIKLYFEGERLAGIGSAEGYGTIEADNCKITVDSLCGPKSKKIGTLSGEARLNNCEVNISD